MVLRTTILLVVLAIPFAAHSQTSCGDPPRVDDQTLKGELDGKAQFLSRLVGDANLKGHIETARTDIFSKYPDAGAAHSDAYLEYMFCSFVLSDPKLSGQDKFRAILDFRQVEKEPVKGAPQVSTTGNQSPAVNSSGNATINYGSTLPPANNSPTPAVPGAAPAPGSIRTEGSQSPAVNSGGNVGIHYGAPPAASH